jgi:hypothetical protein
MKVLLLLLLLGAAGAAGGGGGGAMVACNFSMQQYDTAGQNSSSKWEACHISMQVLLVSW